MNFAKIYRSPEGLKALPATETGDATAERLGLVDTVFQGRAAPLALAQAMLMQFGGEVLSSTGSVLKTYDISPPIQTRRNSILI